MGEKLDSQTADNDEIPTVDPEVEPEYVGAHSARAAPDCQNYLGVGTRSEIEQCGRTATHTIVMKDANGLSEIAMCDRCGEPGDVDRHERKWSGKVIDDD